jgi:hypothetical protein
MRGSRAAAPLAATLAALAIAGLTLYVYRDLPARLFAADDYQWLLSVRGLSLGQVLRRAFDAGAQSHFYRPLVWLLFWAQVRAFGLNPWGFHAVSLALHLLNAGLLAWLAWRLAPQSRMKNEELGMRNFSILHSSFFIPTLAFAFVALHPAPFEAVVWISAQSELLAATLLLVALHLWLPGGRDREAGRQGDQEIGRPGDRETGRPYRSRVSSSPRLLAATLALGLALLAKESAVIGLPLLVLLGRPNDPAVNRSSVQRLLPYLLPALLTLGYLALQVAVERRNYLLEQGAYGLGPQLLINPLRGLALIVAPLAGTEHADNAWLAPVGALVALPLLVALVRGPAGARRLIVALGLTLLPTAPFIAPPNSRYLYLPVMGAASLIALGLSRVVEGRTKNQELRTSRILVLAGSWFLVLGSLILALWASGELHAREGRFAAGTGPGGSLWRLAQSVCADAKPDRMIVVEPPVAPPHVEAIVRLACGSKVRPMVVGRDQVKRSIKGRSVVISFPGGSAAVEPSS